MILRIDDQQPNYLKMWKRYQNHSNLFSLTLAVVTLTIWGNPMACIILLHPNFLTKGGNTKLPMMVVINGMDIMNVAWLKVNGPLGNVVSSFCKSTKLTVAQPLIAPNDIVNKCPRKLLSKKLRENTPNTINWNLTTDYWIKLIPYRCY